MHVQEAKKANGIDEYPSRSMWYHILCQRARAASQEWIRESGRCAKVNAMKANMKSHPEAGDDSGDLL
jgi:hypothetical protein